MGDSAAPNISPNCPMIESESPVTHSCENVSNGGSLLLCVRKGSLGKYPDMNLPPFPGVHVHECFL